MDLKLIGNEMGFTDANSFCNSKGGHIYEPHTAEDVSHLRTITKDYLIEEIWVGLKRIPQHGWRYLSTDGPATEAITNLTQEDDGAYYLGN